LATKRHKTHIKFLRLCVFLWLLLDVPFYAARSDFRTINDSLRVGGNTFGGAGSGEIRTRTRLRIRNESDEAAVFGAADSNAAPPPIVVARDRSGFGIGDVEHVFLIDVQSAGTAELFPFGDEFPILIENLNAVALLIADKQTAFRILF